MCMRKPSETSKADMEHSKKIDQGIRKEHQQQARSFKLLLLGAGNAGKSTFTKQISFIYADVSDEFMSRFVPALRDNCLQAMKLLLNFMEETAGIPSDLTAFSKQVYAASDLEPEIAEAIKSLWNASEVRASLQQAHDTNIQGGISGASYYFKNATRFADQNFRPTKEDVLMVRRKTVGVMETQFEFKSIKFTLVDVGGQRSERKKWISCFDGVTCVIYLAAINEYDMVLEEDSKTNRLLESVKLWRAVTASPAFKSTPFILLLNKSDLFAEKIKLVPLREVFADFEEVINTAEFSHYTEYFEKCWKYMLKQFKYQFEGSKFYPHLTNALDSEICRKVFEFVRETIVTQALQGANVL